MSESAKDNQRVFTELHPKWLDDEVEKECFDEDFRRIILFYVFFSPCAKYSTQGRTLKYYGWKEKPWTPNQYLKEKLSKNIFGEKEKNFRHAQRLEKFKKDLAELSLEDDFYQNLETERVAMMSIGGEGAAYMNLFAHIRCALAHGRVAVYKDKQSSDYFLAMENGKGKKGKFQVRARMVLRKKTLLNWIDIIQTGPDKEE